MQAFIREKMNRFNVDPHNVFSWRGTDSHQLLQDIRKSIPYGIVWKRSVFDVALPRVVTELVAILETMLTSRVFIFQRDTQLSANSEVEHVTRN